MSKNIVIFWFRQDLRLTDNPAFSAASKKGRILPVYILDDTNAKEFKMGAASRIWLHHSLQSLNHSLNAKLSIYKGDSQAILLKIVKNHNIEAIYWNRCYEPWRIKSDEQIKKALKNMNIDVHTYNASLLWEPWQTLKADQTPYKVFTPFYKNACLLAKAPRKPLSKPKKPTLIKDKLNQDTISSLELLPKIPWDKKIEQNYQIGEKAAQLQLNDFLDHGFKNYKEGRDYPSKQTVSRLSPHLHFGEISPNQVWYTAKMKARSKNLESFLKQLAWREFSYSLLYHFPSLPKKNFQKKFDRFQWRKNKKSLIAWQKGQTGYPIIDAGMRELWETGYMHNRVRMIVASFLVKNLLIHWREGEAWFWDCLVDADLANNSASWQWVAGCGADPAPYFRIFNPVTQGQKFDPDGLYTRQYVPELNNLPNQYLFNPWEASSRILQDANIILGKTYPKPIVNLQESRQRALDVFSSLK